MRKDVKPKIDGFVRCNLLKLAVVRHQIFLLSNELPTRSDLTDADANLPHLASHSR